MKRPLLHIIFWLCYWSFNLYLDFDWMRLQFPDRSNSTRLLDSIIGTTLYMLPLAGAAYYLAYCSLDIITRKKRSAAVNAVIISLPYLSAVIVAVCIVRLIVFPYIYHWTRPEDAPFFDIGRFFSITVETAFPAAILLGIRLTDTQLAAKEKEKKLLQEKLTTELQLLKNQLNPHFLFNTLNNIYALTRKKSDQAPEVVLKLSELLSFMLYDAGGTSIPISKEIKFLNDYIALQRIRYTDDILSLQFTAETDDPYQPVAPLILLPLVENAFKHGAGENLQGSFIDIYLQVKEKRMLFIIKNSYEETPGTVRPEAIGLANTSRQLELLYHDHKLDIDRRGNVFTVRLSINLDSHEKI